MWVGERQCGRQCGAHAAKPDLGELLQVDKIAGALVLVVEDEPLIALDISSSLRDAGAQVVIVEKGLGGGNTKLATNAFVCPTDNAAARAHIKALSFGLVSEEIIDVYVHWTAQNIEYIKQLGGEVEGCFPGASFPQVTGAETMLRFRVKGTHPDEMGGTSLWNLLSDNLARRTIPIYRHAPARKILRSGDQVIGVQIEKEGRPYYLRGRKGGRAGYRWI